MRILKQVESTKQRRGITRVLDNLTQQQQQQHQEQPQKWSDSPALASSSLSVRNWSSSKRTMLKASRLPSPYSMLVIVVCSSITSLFLWDSIQFSCQGDQASSADILMNNVGKKQLPNSWEGNDGAPAVAISSTLTTLNSSSRITPRTKTTTATGSLSGKGQQQLTANKKENEYTTCKGNSVPLLSNDKDNDNGIMCQCLPETPICGGPLCQTAPATDTSTISSPLLLTPPQMMYPAKCGDDCQCVEMLLPFYGCSSKDVIQGQISGASRGLGSVLNNLMLLGAVASLEEESKRTFNLTCATFGHGCHSSQDEDSYTCLLYPVSPCPDLPPTEYKRSPKLNKLKGQGGERMLMQYLEKNQKRCCSSESSSGSSGTRRSVAGCELCDNQIKNNDELSLRFQAAQRILRFIPPVERRIQHYLQMDEFFRSNDEPYLSFHVRRGDKLTTFERGTFIPLQVYVEAALSLPESKGITRALVASDLQEASQELIQLLADRGIVAHQLSFSSSPKGNNNFGKQEENLEGGSNVRRIHGETKGYGYTQQVYDQLSQEEKLQADCRVLAEVRALSKGKVMVGTISSNLFRLALALRGTDQGVLSLDRDPGGFTKLSNELFWDSPLNKPDPGMTRLFLMKTLMVKVQNFFATGSLNIL